MTSPRLWFEGARPKTLGAGLTPVIVGAGVAQTANWRTAAALVVALGLQVGVNYANDYSDGVRGVDTAQRVGPVRLVGSGLATPRAVAIAAGLSFATAAVAGGVLALAVDVRLLAVGLASLLAAVGYSAGPRPYAGMGLGELFVLIFFGPVAVAGTTYVTIRSVPAAGWWAGMAIGGLAVGILMANNLRDIATDSASGKRTLAVRLGDKRTRILFQVVLAVSVLLPVAAVFFEAMPAGVLIATFTGLVFAHRPAKLARTAQGPQLVAVLLGTARLQLVFGVLLAAGLLVGVQYL